MDIVIGNHNIVCGSEFLKLKKNCGNAVKFCKLEKFLNLYQIIKFGKIINFITLQNRIR